MIYLGYDDYIWQYNTWTIYFDCVNWLSGRLSFLRIWCLLEIDGNITKYNLVQRIDGYTIEVNECSWHVYVASCLLLSGQSTSNAKMQALQAMSNYLRGHNDDR